MHSAGCPCQGHIQCVYVVNCLSETFLKVVSGKQVLLASAGKFHIKNPLGKGLQGSPVLLRETPVARGLVKAYFLGEREDDIREVQTLGLVHCHYSDCITSGGRTDGRILALPPGQETLQGITFQ